MARIIWTLPAIADLDMIADFIAIESRAAAKALVMRVYRHVTQLRDHPLSGSQPPEIGRSRYRQLIEPSYRIFYRVDGSIVVVLFVMRSDQPRDLGFRTASRSPVAGRPG